MHFTPIFSWKPVERHGTHALEHGVGLAAHLHAVDDVVAFGEVVDHLRDGLEIILKVGINGDDGIGMVFHRHHAGHDSILVTDVVGKIDAAHERILLLQLADDVPCMVTASIVDKDNL